MATRDDGDGVESADTSDTLKTINNNRNNTDASSSSNHSQSNSNCSITTNPSNGSAQPKHWFRSIPRRIRKFITKRHHRPVDQPHTQDELADSAIATTSNAVYADQRYVGDADGTDESTLYSMIDYVGNDEDVAMLRACSQMARYGWFWGPITRQAAQQRLHGTPNGSFLVRNSQINLHNYTISFRTAGKTLHYRIEFVEGYWQTFNSKHRSIVDLIDDAMQKSKETVFCYVKQNSQLAPPFPVRLTYPISHFGDIPSLQHLCRLVIYKKIADIGKIDLLPLPTKLILYCKEMETIYGEMPMRTG